MFQDTLNRYQSPPKVVWMEDQGCCEGRIIEASVTTIMVLSHGLQCVWNE